MARLVLKKSQEEDEVLIRSMRLNDSSNPLTWITTYVIVLLLVLFGSDAHSAVYALVN